MCWLFLRACLFVCYDISAFWCLVLFFANLSNIRITAMPAMANRIAYKTCGSLLAINSFEGSSLYWAGKTFDWSSGTLSPWLFTQEMVCFQGQTLFNEPIIKPARTAIVLFLKFLSNHDSKLEKLQ